jgi:thiol-disulfide isomerase/thioredoxin
MHASPLPKYKNMKKIFLLSFALFFWFFGTAQRNQPTNPGFELTVRIDGYPEGETVRMGRYYGAQTLFVQNIDTVMFDKKRNVYVIRRTEPLEAGMYMLVSHENVPAEFIVDQSQQFRIDMKYPEFGVDMKFTGSPENKLFVDFNDRVRPLHQEFGELRRKFEALEEKNSPEGQELTKQIQDILKRIEDIRAQFIEDNPRHLMAAFFRAQRDIEVPEAPDDIPEDERNHWRYNYFKDNYFGNMDLSDDRLLRTPIFHQRLENYIDKVLSQHPDSLISGIDRLMDQIRNTPELFRYVLPFVLNKYSQSQIIGYDAIWVHLGEKYYLSGDATWASEAQIENIRNAVNKAKPLLIGTVPPEFASPDSNDIWRSVFSAPTRYTVVVFWEPNCGFCKRQMAALRDLYNEKRKELDFEVFAVCRVSNFEACKNYHVSNDMPNWILVDGFRATARYDESWDLHSVPVIYILDSQNRIVTKKIEAEQIEPFIRNWNVLHYND